MLSPKYLSTNDTIRMSWSKSVQNLSEAVARRQVSLDIKCLQILRCMIHNHIVQIDPELKERDPEEYRRLVAREPMQYGYYVVVY